MRTAPYVLAATIMMTALALVTTGCKKVEKPTVETPAIPVTVTAIRPVDLREEVEVTGTLQPADEVIVSTRGEGRISWIIGKEGTPVRRGQVVARMEDQDARTMVRSAQAALQGAKARLEQAKAAVLQQMTSTDTGIANADAAVQAAKARLLQAKTSADFTDATTNAQVKTAQAALDSARSRLALVKNGARKQERAVAENAVKLAKATYDLDKSNYDRYKDLYDNKAVAKTTLDSAETKMQVSKVQYDSAAQQLNMIQEGAREEDVQAAEAAVRQAEEGLTSARANLKQVDVAKANVEIAKTGVAQAEAALDAARSARQVNVMRDKDVLAAEAAVQQSREMVTTALQTLDYTEIFSPVDGVVSAKLAEVGNTAGKFIPVLKISTNQSLYFQANVSELDAPRLRSGQQVMLTVDALQANRANPYLDQQKHVVAGTVERVVPVVDARTRNFLVRIIVPRSASLFPGMFASGKIVSADHRQVIAVPKDALMQKDDRNIVFTAENGIARKRDVTVGAVNGTLVQILSGLSQGEQVVTVGQQSLVDGDKVSTKPMTGKE
ncbi:MAG: efflux RND transporter periplasmic adaptor subunit [Armatimonadota bacterium]